MLSPRPKIQAQKMSRVAVLNSESRETPWTRDTQKPGLYLQDILISLQPHFPAIPGGPKVRLLAQLFRKSPGFASLSFLILENTSLEIPAREWRVKHQSPVAGSRDSE